MEGILTKILGLFLIFSLGCGEKGDDSGHAHGELSGAGGSAVIKKLARPASKLKEVKAGEAWKTPLNLALFHAQQYKGKRSYGNQMNGVVIALVEAGELGQATEVALLLSSGTGAFALAYVAKATAESGNAIQASKVAQWVEPPSDRAIALCHAATAQLKAGDKPPALVKIRQAEELARKIPQKKKASVLIAIASAQSWMDEKKWAVETCRQALKWVRANKNSFSNTGHYKSIARVLVRAGEIRQVKGLVQSDGSMFGNTMSASTRKDIAVIMAEEGELEAALEWIGQFPVNGTPDKQKQDAAYSEIAIALAKKGQIERAMQVMNRCKIRMFSWRMELGKLASVMAKAGKIKEALKVIQETRGVSNEGTLRAIASAQVAAGQKAQALETLKQAEKAVEKSSELFMKKHDALKNLAVAYAEASDKEQAVAKLKQAVEAAKVYEKNRFSSASKESTIALRLMDLLPAVINVADKELQMIILKQVVDLAQGIEDANEKANTLSRISRRLLQAGQYKQAMKTVLLIEAAERRKSAMWGLAGVLPVLPETNMRLRHINFIDIKSMKKDFTPEEQEFAKQLVEAIQAK
jgi:tetratricopeptide (TPR) repeat protein